ncbi:MAG: hypothetical protein M1823_000589 [Watsoniomyces obsoletus]|nr:MAG: hypothetical protein M1823_000589 [Watsoniomyces obsoletus]
MRCLLSLLLALWATVALGQPHNLKLVKREGLKLVKRQGCTLRGIAKTACLGISPLVKGLGVNLEPGYCGDIMDGWGMCKTEPGAPTNNLVLSPGMTYQISAAGVPSINGAPIQNGGTAGAATAQKDLKNGGKNGAANGLVVPTTGDQPATSEPGTTEKPANGGTNRLNNGGLIYNNPYDRSSLQNPADFNGQNTQSNVNNYQPATNSMQASDLWNPDGTPKKKEGFNWEDALGQFVTALADRQQNGAYDSASAGDIPPGSDYNYNYYNNVPGANYGASGGTSRAPAPAAGGIGRNGGIVYGNS